MRHPSTPILFGAVSVSNLYSFASRELIPPPFCVPGWRPPSLVAKIESRRARFTDPQVRGSPRTRLHPGVHSGRRFRARRQLGARRERPADSGKALFKAWRKTLAFAVDPKFSDSLDALIMVDLRASDPALLSRYMGAAGAGGSFLGTTRAAS